jgi:hypothetical protein
VRIARILYVIRKVFAIMGTSVGRDRMRIALLAVIRWSRSIGAARPLTRQPGLPQGR